MDLREIQTTYLNLLKGKADSRDMTNEYFKEVSSSKNFKVLNDIVLFWRSHGIKEYCTLTSSFLIKTGLFEEKVKSFYRDVNFSGYIEEHGKEFLDYLAADENELVSFVADFESSLIKVKLGNNEVFNIFTFYDPQELFEFILGDNDFPERSQKSFLVKVSREFENDFEIEEMN